MAQYKVRMENQDGAFRVVFAQADSLEEARDRAVEMVKDDKDQWTVYGVIAPGEKERKE